MNNNCKKCKWNYGSYHCATCNNFDEEKYGKAEKFCYYCNYNYGSSRCNNCNYYEND